jgi:lipopolysaccharide transport system ATP-binding protein
MANRRIAISAESISKCYRIGLKDELHESYAAALFDFLKSPINNYRKYRSLYTFDDIDLSDGNGAHQSADVYWALRDVSFSIDEGDSLAIIGRNGAGKSTLLKILCRITTPTLGRARIRGKISSLLEVGTGFHKELTGRENVYLNGTILGMSKKEVDTKLDEIIDFSGVEKFIDTPVKRYSSGMKVRLAFSVAAHLEPEILIVDEVLAVGDADFQKKCLNKMKDIGELGRTVIFVSHNMQAVTRLCRNAILLDRGKMIGVGTSEQMVAEYLSEGKDSQGSQEWPDPESAPSGEFVRLRSVKVFSDGAEAGRNNSFPINKPVFVQMAYDVIKPGCKLLPHFLLHNDAGILIFTSLDTDPEWRNVPRSAGRYVSTAKIPANLLTEGLMFISPAMHTLSPKIFQFYVQDAVVFNVIEKSDENTDSARGDWGGGIHGVVRPLLEWKTARR